MMDFTRQQRDQLEILSQDLFRSPSAWKKVLNDPELQVVESVEKVPSKYIYVEHKRGKFQAITVEKARALGYKLPEPLPMDEIEHKRPMTFEELTHALLAAQEMKQFATIHKEHGEAKLYEWIIKRYREGILINTPYLIVPNDSKAQFADLFEAVPEDHRKVLADFVVPNSNPKLFCVDGEKFICELTYQLSYSDEQRAEHCPPEDQPTT
jgi:hypothetical protein